MEHLGGEESALVGSHESYLAVTPFTIKMPVSRDDLCPVPLHIVKSAVWYESGSSVADTDAKGNKPEYFEKFSPGSARNESVRNEKAPSLRYTSKQGTIDIITLPFVAMKDIRIEVHEQQITIIALARHETIYTEIGIIDETSPPDVIYTFNTETKNVFAIVAGYKKGQLQLFLGRTKLSDEEQQITKSWRRSKNSCNDAVKWNS